MKIIKYSADNLSSGSLCGLDVDESLQVTHCFPVVDEAESKLESHQIGMLRSLREVRPLDGAYAWRSKTDTAPRNTACHRYASVCATRLSVVPFAGWGLHGAAPALERRVIGDQNTRVPPSRSRVPSCVRVLSSLTPLRHCAR